jgi:hypothetical protein
MELYITARLENPSINAYINVIKAIIINVNQFLEILVQLYGDLNEVRTSEL